MDPADEDAFAGEESPQGFQARLLARTLRGDTDEYLPYLVR